MSSGETNPRFTAGFTLIEVLAALIIVTLGMLGAIQAVTQSAGNGSYIRDKTLAHWIAMNRLTETRLAGKPPAIEDSSGEVDYAKQRWRWTMKVSKTGVESMLRMDVSVAPADAAQKTALATVTGFYGAAIAPLPATMDWDAQAGQGGAQPTNPGTTNPTAPTTPVTTPPPVTNSTPPPSE